MGLMEGELILILKGPFRTAAEAEQAEVSLNKTLAKRPANL